MQLFYAPEITFPDYTLPEEESKHVVRVLRKGRGDVLCLTDGRGNLHRCEIVDEDPRRCRIRRCETLTEQGRLPYRLTLAVAPTKNIDRYEWLLEKATEIGVAEIVPLESEHSERRIFKPERGERIVIAAMKQSLKCYLPHLAGLTPFEELLARPFEGQRFIAHCDTPRSAEGRQFLPTILQPGGDVMILIGPEGDFSPAEIDRALACGFREITLGNQRLRTETAAVVATTMVAAANHTPEK